MTEYSLALYSPDLPDIAAEMLVSFRPARPRGLINYSVVLRIEFEGRWRTVRVYDYAHGYPHMHRYTRGDGRDEAAKVPGVSTAQEGLKDGMQQVAYGWVDMVQAWLR